MKRISFAFLCITLLISCEEEPDTRPFPIIRTMPVENADESGATFKGELIKKGSEPTSSYGFMWISEKDTNEAILGQDLTSKNFEKRISYALFKGVRYQIRAFARYGNKVVYGNPVIYRSLGCLSGAWSFETTVRMDGTTIPYGYADAKNGCILFQSSQNYVYDTEKRTLTQTSNYPGSGNSESWFTVINAGYTQYFFTNISNKLYKRESGLWSQISDVPYNYSDQQAYHHGFYESNKLYILSSDGSFMYDLSTKSWQSRSALPTGYISSVGGTNLSGYAYVMTKDKSIWKYIPSMDYWTSITHYPGDLNDKIIAFTSGNKIYFGLSYHNHYAGYLMDNKLWSYNTGTNEWTASESFPEILPAGEVFFFSVNGSLYLGHSENYIYNIWKFNPSKL